MLENNAVLISRFTKIFKGDRKVFCKNSFGSSNLCLAALEKYWYENLFLESWILDFEDLFAGSDFVHFVQNMNQLSQAQVLIMKSPQFSLFKSGIKITEDL